MEKVCDYCNGVFEAKKSNALYCTATCRQKAYLKRKKGDNNRPLNGIAHQSGKPVGFDATLRQFIYELEGDVYDNDIDGYGQVFSGTEALQECFLPVEKLFSTEDIALKLLKYYDDKPSLFVLKVLDDSGILASDFASVLVNERLPNPYHGIPIHHHCLQTSNEIKRLFRLLLLFDRQYVLLALLQSIRDKLVDVLKNLSSAIKEKCGEEVLAHWRLAEQLNQVLAKKSADGRIWFGLSTTMRNCLQDNLICYHNAKLNH